MSVDPSKLKVNELKDELEKLGLPTKGLKAELVKRLTEALATEGGGAETEAMEAETTTSKKRGRAPSTRKAAKKQEVEEEEEEEEDDDEEEEEKPKAKESKKEEEEPKSTGSKKIGKPKVDQYYGGGGEVYVSDTEAFDVMLNQTNIGQNNNKFYVIQLIKNGGAYSVFTRWGRVGERGQHASKPCGSSLDAALKEFKKKFKEKSANDWDKRHNFVPKANKYTLLEMDYGDDDEDDPEEAINSKLAEKGHKLTSKESKVRPCSLDTPTQKLVNLIFNVDMFKEALVSFNIDVKKMPLGKISKGQLKKGFEVLEEIEKEIKSGKGSSLSDLSSKFYTLIPHDFGRKVPPPIRDAETLQQKMDLLEVLGDIEMAQGLIKKPSGENGEEWVDHPTDVNYKKLKNKITHVSKSDEIYQIIENYVKTTSGWKKPEIIDIFEIDREGEKERFSKHKDLKNRRLLWHGTNVAVMVAILSTGLRIMPHSGGRVGRGIYFASEHSKSAGYVRAAHSTYDDGANVGIMLLNEVALGKEHSITRDDSSLRMAPPGYDSIVARGRTEPDPTKDVTIEGSFGPITVAQGKVLDTEYKDSSFFQSEYLVYQESQAYMRYLIKFKW